MTDIKVLDSGYCYTGSLLVILTITSAEVDEGYLSSMITSLVKVSLPFSCPPKNSYIFHFSRKHSRSRERKKQKADLRLETVMKI